MKLLVPLDKRDIDAKGFSFKDFDDVYSVLMTICVTGVCYKKHPLIGTSRLIDLKEEGGTLMAVLWDAAREFLTVEEAAKYLGVKQSEIYTLAWRKTIPSVRMDYRLLFDREDLDKLRAEPA